jgi:3-oxoacyl-[acyl-carrier protein] reductase
MTESQNHGMRTEKRLDGRVAVVTGGTRGLGKALVEGLVAEGASVLYTSRGDGREADFEPREHGRAVHVRADVRDQDSVEKVMDRALTEFGSLDVLVCNAGTNRDARIAEMTPEDWTEVLSINLTGVFLCCQAAASRMSKNGGGRIITVSSCMSSRSAIGTAAYSASKAGLEAFTRAAAAEFARDGITVNCVAPGFMEVGMGAVVASNSKIWSRYSRFLLAGRLGKSSEFVAAIAFLASDDSSYINGHVLEVNGGLRWIC